MGEASDSDVGLHTTLSTSLPITNPCLSHWQRTSRAFSLLSHNQHLTPPTVTKFAIIGSGIAGGLAAFELIDGGVTPSDITIFEAREACSGASSRNAGHVRPDAFRGFQAYSKLHGAEQALKIIANERLVLERVDEFVKKHNVPCDFHLTTTFDVCMTPEFAAYQAASFEAFESAGGDVSHVRFYEGREAQARTGIQAATAAYGWPGGSSHPAKLAQWLIADVVGKGAGLWTHCPVLQVQESIERSEDQSLGPHKRLWRVQTARGAVLTQNIIYCTNANTGALVPQLVPYITPNRAQAHALIPTPAFSGDRVMRDTFSLRYSLHRFYSLIQRQSDGTIILGVSRLNPTLSPETVQSRLSIDDSSYNKELVYDALRHFNMIFPEYEAGGYKEGEGLDHAWTGIIAMTTDSVPFVGEIPDHPGQYICAGFNGHGMARIFTAAPGIAKLILGKDWIATGLPECFQLTKERLQRMANMEHSHPVW